MHKCVLGQNVNIFMQIYFFFPYAKTCKNTCHLLRRITEAVVDTRWRPCKVRKFSIKNHLFPDLLTKENKTDICLRTRFENYATRNIGDMRNLSPDVCLKHFDPAVENWKMHSTESLKETVVDEDKRESSWRVDSLLHGAGFIVPRTKKVYFQRKLLHLVKYRLTKEKISQ